MLAAIPAHAEIIGAKVVDAMDLQISPNKYKQKGIEVRGVRCYHADEDEYRCTHTSADIMIMGLNIEPASAKSALEESCGEIRKVFSSPKCRFTIRLYPSLIDQDEISGGQKRTVIGAETIEIVK
ncbi:hypothetical protein AA309_12065 [Microvirga vignae]|uniref:Uncharacterized protein n=1 Tax=Microvirga vignae TaxID=1225564 RepID=A0A0H1RCR9_9HYPH|nr:hypothetical protein [Microvirga vignae]KLK92854.1 hypothetical protein AA309_12065 [Microvirga vignae]